MFNQQWDTEVWHCLGKPNGITIPEVVATCRDPSDPLALYMADKSLIPRLSIE